MIREDADNLQRQLVHLFRVFEVDVSVGNDERDGSYGVTLGNTDGQVFNINDLTSEEGAL